MEAGGFEFFIISAYYNGLLLLFTRREATTKLGRFVAPPPTPGKVSAAIFSADGR
jgi:hypothetical protein